MKIKTLRADGIKGSKSFEHQLAGVTVFTGVNAQGKTTRLEALSLALAGSLPGVASKPSDVHERLASAPLLAVSIDTDQGGRIGRSWTKSGKGVKSENVFYGFPDGFAVAPVSLDPTVFLGLSEKERVKFLFRTLPPPSLEKVGPSALVANIKNIKLDQNTPETEAANAELCRWVENEWKSNLDLSLNTFKLPVQEWLDQLAEKVRLKKNEAAAAAKRMEQTVQGLTQLKVDSQSFAVAERAKQEAQTALDAAKRDLNDRRGDLQRAQTALRDAQTLAGQAIDETTARAELATATAAVESLNVILAEPFDPKAESAAAQRLSKAQAAFATASANVSAAEREIISLKRDLTAIVESPCCPTCKSKKQGWRDELVAEKQAALESKADALSVLVSQQDAAQNEVNAAQTARNEAQRVRDERQTNSTNLNGWSAEVTRLERLLNGNASALTAKTKLPELEQLVGQASVAMSTAATVQGEAQTKFDQADQVHRRAIADKATAASQARALSEAAKAKAEVEIIKQFADFLNELMVKVIEQSIQPMLATCNNLCDGVLRSPLVLRDGEIGMDNPDSATGFVSWRTFSGAERQLTFAALSVALSVGQPFKLVLIDEFGKLSSGNKTKMFARLLELVERGTIDQAIIVDPDTSFYRNVGAVENFSCIEVVRE